MAEPDILTHTSDIPQYNHYCCNPKCKHHKSVPRTTRGYWMKGNHPCYFTLNWLENAMTKNHSVFSGEDGKVRIYGQPISDRYQFDVKIEGMGITDFLCETCYQVRRELLYMATLVPTQFRACSNPLCDWHNYNVAPGTTTIQYGKEFKHQLGWPNGRKYVSKLEQYQLKRYALQYMNHHKENICLCENCFEVGILLGEFKTSGDYFSHPNVQIVT